MNTLTKFLRCVLFACILLGAPFAQAQVSLAVNLSVSNPSVESNNPFFYNIGFAVTSTNEPGKDVVITDTLPTHVEFKDVVSSSLIASSTFDAATRVVSIKLVNPLPAGTTGSVQINCAFTRLLTPKDYVATNKVVISASNTVGGPIFSNSVNLKAIASAPYSITKMFDSYDAYNKIVTWRTYLNLASCCNCENVGMLAINDVTITDSLPAGAVFVSATNGGKETSPGSGKVVWDMKGKSFDYCNPYNQYLSKVSIQYPTTPYGTDVANSTSFSGTLTGNLPIKGTSPDAHYRLHDPNATGDCYTNANNYFRAYLGGIGSENNGISVPFKNSGNVPFDNMTVEVTIPEQVEANGIIQGDTSLHPKIYYTTNTNPTTKVEIPITKIQYPNVPIPLFYDGWPLPTLPTGVYVTKVYLSYQKVAPGFESAFGIPLSILKTDRNGNQVTATLPFYPQTPCDGNGTCIHFKSKIDFTANGQTISSYCTWDGMPKGLAPDITTMDKDIMNPKSFVPGDTINFRLLTFNSGDAIENMVFADTLANEFDYVPNSWTAQFIRTNSNKPSAANAVFTKNGQAMTFDFSSDTNGFAFTSVIINYKVRIKPGVPTGVYYNKFYGKADNYPTVWSGQKAVVINSVNSVIADKGVKGAVNTQFLFYPQNATTINGSEVDYKLRVTNTGNTKLKEVVLVDALPFKGDDRGSEFTPFMTSLPTANKGKVAIYYSLDSTICVNEISPPINPAGCMVPTWSSTPPTDIKQIKAMKFFLADSLDGGDSLTVTWKMSAPSNLTVNQVAYNNFYYQARKADDNSLLLTTSPNKVGVVISALGQIGEYVWLDKNGNGLRDEDPSAGMNIVFVELWKPGNDQVPNTSDDVLFRTTVTLNNFEGEPGYYNFSADPGVYFMKFKVDTCLYHSTTLNYTTPLFTLAPAQRKMDMNLGLDTNRVSVSSPQTCLGANVTLTSVLKANFKAPVYQWEASPNCITWTDLPGQNNATLTLTNTTLADAIGYRVRVSESGSINPACKVTSKCTPLNLSGTFSDPVYKDTAICSGKTLTLHKSLPISSSYYWYTFATGGTPHVNPYVTPALTGTTTFYLLDSAGSCKSQRVPVLVTVNASPTTPAYTAPNSICQGQAVTLNKNTPTASGTYFWYRTSTGGVPLANNVSTPALSSTATYYLIDSSTTTGCTSLRAPVTVTVQPLPLDPTYASPSVCSGKSIFLNKTNPAPTGTYYWYASLTGSPLANGLTTPTLTANTTYYLQDSSTTTGCASKRSPVQIQVDPVPAAPSYTAEPICQGKNVVLNKTTPASMGTYFWYTSSTGGRPLTNNFPTPNLSITATYYLIDSSTITACASQRVPISIPVNPTPADPSYAVAPICKGESVLLNKTSPSPFGGYYWHTTPTGGTPMANGLRTPAIVSSTVYYLADSVFTTHCASQRVPVTIPLKSSLDDPNYSVPTACIGGTVVLNKTSPNPTGTYFWYTGPSGGSPLVNNFTLTHLLSSTTYYLIDSVAGTLCRSNRVAVSLLVQDCTKDTTSKTIPEIFFPNGFSPNNDGISDYYTVFDVPEGVSVSIWFFNRWGDLVYKNEEYKNTWDGKCEAEKCLGENLPSGTYYMQAVLSNNKKYNLNVTLIR